MREVLPPEEGTTPLLVFPLEFGQAALDVLEVLPEYLGLVFQPRLLLIPAQGVTDITG
jgi:hypothetical protein